MKSICIVAILIFFIAAHESVGQTTCEPLFKTNKEAHNLFLDLYNQGSFEDAANILRKSYKMFPDNLEANTFNLAIALGHLNELDEGLSVLIYGLEQGIWYNVLALSHDLFSPYLDFPGFADLKERNIAKKNEASLLSKTQYIVKTPKDYDKEIPYPLFIGLHGAGESLKAFPDVWTSNKVSENCISVYIQSSQMVSLTGYTWSDDMDLSVKEIDSIFTLVRDSFPVLEDQVIISGFSSGGIAAMEVTLRNTFPVAGFISLCPDRPEAFSDENIAKAKDRGVRGIILTTELDPRIELQKEMSDELTRIGLSNFIVITPNTGHWIPDDLGEQIDKALKYILR
ncbi:MAG: hypothetical protein HN936_08510 [Bacteroidetes bacterium]|jgi:predicted esterase|nr:hypothetical protein [Bacteroidota bacterium]MBT4411730.1 hypothetical protein [Bacteroidota bacterium]MBT5425841.1 hypothetical protein [Bacteroidota bacterium]MBT7093274.1 hypothetical protein [Bacteroidota bacterium]MBT7462807.1 hypothetical protein [Bacteroidota bacterium]